MPPKGKSNVIRNSKVTENNNTPKVAEGKNTPLKQMSSTNNKSRAMLENQRKGVPNTRVYIRDIPEIKSWKEINKYLFDGVGFSAFVKLHIDIETEEYLGHGLLTFETANQASKAIKFINSNQFKGVMMTAMMAVTNVVNNKIPLENKLANLSLESEEQETYGLSRKFLKSLGIKRLPLLNTVCIRNVPLSANERDIHSLLGIAGTVINVKLLPIPEYGVSKRSVYAEYSHPLEAVQCVSMLTNQIYRGNSLHVNMSNPLLPVNSIIDDVPIGLESVGAGLGRGGAPLELRDVEPSSEWISPVYPSKPTLRTPYNFNGAKKSPGSSISKIVEPINHRSGPRSPFDNHRPPMDYRNPNYESPSNRYSDRSFKENGSGDFRDQQSGMDNSGYIRNEFTRRPLLETPSFERGYAPQRGIGPPFGNPPMKPEREQPTEILLSNLPRDFSDGDIYKLSWNCGDVLSAEMRAPGVGIIKFHSEEEALRGCKILNQRPLEGRMISARPHF